MKLDAQPRELARRVLPALRMMLRFPTRPNKNVSFETSIELSDIEAWTTAHGRPTAVLLDQLEAELEGKGPAKTRAAATESKAPAETEPAAAAPSPAKRTVTEVRNRSSDSKRAAATDSSQKFLAIAKALLADPLLLQAEACRRVGLNQGTWSYFKTREFGPGLVARDKLAAWIAGQRSSGEEPKQLAPAGSAPEIPPSSPIRADVEVKTEGPAANPTRISTARLELVAALMECAAVMSRTAVLVAKEGAV